MAYAAAGASTAAREAAHFAVPRYFPIELAKCTVHTFLQECLLQHKAWHCSNSPALHFFTPFHLGA